ncbi:hypothetical protein B0H16DRAFT_1739141 [Mycena metata]|uniref:Uncharacterized protein n=1 Tax=Mycena metata TaxID=1033252 RepID=A0AAD7HH14_9AGAR|nr:hypothetical protein B0H16DRAFT_1739141 [Mycena metata]
MSAEARPHFSSAQIKEYREFAVYVLNSDPNKAKQPVPYGYDDYVYYEHKEGQHDGLPYSQPGMDGTYVPAAAASTTITAANATAVSTNNTVVLSTPTVAVGDGNAFVYHTATEFLNFAKDAMGFVISGGEVARTRGRGRGPNNWRGSHWTPRPHKQYNPYRGGTFANEPRDFGLRREHRDDAYYNRDRRGYYREDYHDRDRREDYRDDYHDRRDYRQHDDEAVVSDYLKNHPDKLRELVERAKGTPDPADVLKLGGLNLDGKGKGREGEAGPSAGAYREKKKDAGEESDAEGTVDGEAAD